MEWCNIVDDGRGKENETEQDRENETNDRILSGWPHFPCLLFVVTAHPSLACCLWVVACRPFVACYCGSIPLLISRGGGLLPNAYGYYRWYKGRMRRRPIKLRKVVWMMQGCRGGHTSLVLLLVAAAHALVDCFFLLVPISFVSFLSLYTMYYIYYKYYRCCSPPYSSSPSIVCTTYDIVIIYDI